MTANTLFTAPVDLDLDSQREWIHLLAERWTATVGRPPGFLDDDLELLSPIYSHNTSPRTIRERIYSMPEIGVDDPQFPSEAVLVVDNCAMITPEGRILLHILTEIRRLGLTHIDTDRRIWALSKASSLRSEWHSRWIRKQFESSMSRPVIGGALFLLVNGSIGRENSLRMPANARADVALGHVIMPMIANFSSSLGSTQQLAIDSGLRQHWVFTQLSRLCGRDVGRGTVDEDTTTWIHRSREHHFLDNIARRLEHSAPDHLRRDAAVSRFISDYRSARGPLAAAGVMHEDPTRTQGIIRRLLNGGLTS